jgi:hypothetical protein
MRWDGRACSEDNDYFNWIETCICPEGATDDTMDTCRCPARVLEAQLGNGVHM